MLAGKHTHTHMHTLLISLAMWLYLLSTSFRSTNHANILKQVRRFQLCHQFLAVFLLCEDVVTMSQMGLYIELDHHSYSLPLSWLSISLKNFFFMPVVGVVEG